MKTIKTFHNHSTLTPFFIPLLKIAVCPDDSRVVDTNEDGAFDTSIEGPDSGSNPQDAIDATLQLCDDSVFIAKPLCDEGLGRIMVITGKINGVSQIQILLLSVGGTVVDEFTVSCYWILPLIYDENIHRNVTYLNHLSYYYWGVLWRRRDS